MSPRDRGRAMTQNRQLKDILRANIRLNFTTACTMCQSHGLPCHRGTGACSWCLSYGRTCSLTPASRMDRRSIRPIPELPTLQEVIGSSLGHSSGTTNGTQTTFLTVKVGEGSTLSRRNTRTSSPSRGQPQRQDVSPLPLTECFVDGSLLQDSNEGQYIPPFETGNVGPYELEPALAFTVPNDPVIQSLPNANMAPKPAALAAEVQNWAPSWLRWPFVNDVEHTLDDFGLESGWSERGPV
ncbi:hypothetical protein BKA70DRAFT_1235591 [Coprinopsis sp. MPI-PUGE-AT-0042]|nr:hypothetical protein BKA70DRAFT_1235591 [Coprinopsis sp. MPI-PUGE-AT-0042]